MNTSNHEIWGFITRNESKKVPEWICKMHTLNVDDLVRDQQFRAELKKVTPSYLEHLREQIGLQARGLEWSEILKNRLKALEPYLEVFIVWVIISVNNRTVTLEIDPNTDTIIHIEEY